MSIALLQPPHSGVSHVPCGQGQGNGLAAEWCESLVLDVSLAGLAAADAVLLLEVLQLPTGFTRFKVCAFCMQEASTHVLPAQ